MRNEKKTVTGMGAEPPGMQAPFAVQYYLRRTAEERFASVVERIGQGIIVTDRDGRVLYANPAAARLLGRDILELVGNHLEIPQPDSAGNIPWPTASGNLEIHVTETTWDGQPARLLSIREICRDKELKAFASGVAHDLSSILCAMRGYAQLAHEGLPVDHPVRADLENLSRAAGRAVELMNRIRSFGRGMEPAYKPLLLEPVVEEAIALLRGCLPATIEVETHLGPCGPVLADATSIHRVIMNLCSNASCAIERKRDLNWVDASGAAHDRLVVSLSEVRVEDTHGSETAARASVQETAAPALRPGSYALVTVEDTGCGMDEPTRAGVMQSADGLGLATVKAILHGHQGSLACESAPGRGTKFSVYLPLCPVA